MALILIVDDDEEVGQTIKLNLTKCGYHVIWVDSAYEALQRVRRQRPDLFILDIAMPAMDGIELCQRIRMNQPTDSTPILFLTASADIQSKIKGFNAGADDYLVKPFNLQELELRVRALLRRGAATPNASQVLTLGPLSLNCQTFEVRLGQKSILLTPVEFELLFFLMSHPSRVFSTEQLLRDVWQYPPNTGSPEVVRAHIKNLRNKIEPDPHKPIYLLTVGRFGYSLQADKSTLS